MLKNFLAKFQADKEKFKEMESDMRNQNLLEQRQKNSNERELERFMEEERQKDIKVKLDMFRAQKRDEFFRGNNMLKVNNVFTGHHSVLTDNSKMMKNNKMFTTRSTFLR